MWRKTWNSIVCRKLERKMTSEGNKCLYVLINLLDTIKWVITWTGILILAHLVLRKLKHWDTTKMIHNFVALLCCTSVKWQKKLLELESMWAGCCHCYLVQMPTLTTTIMFIFRKHISGPLLKIAVFNGNWKEKHRFSFLFKAVQVKLNERVISFYSFFLDF